MNNIDKTKKLINVINNVHLQYSKDYFETGKIEKINLTKTSVPVEHILRYRLNLHESINDYLIEYDLDNITYYYRIKTSESILDKIERNNKNKSNFYFPWELQLWDENDVELNISNHRLHKRNFVI